MKTLLVIFICLVGFDFVLNSQDVHFSQFYNAPLLQNPAMAGASNPSEFGLQYRSQWRSVAIPYKTYAAAASARLKKGDQKTGFWAGGINFYNDRSGDGQLETTVGNFSAAYHVAIGAHHTFGLGMQGGFGQRKLNTDDFQWGSQYAGTSYNGALPTGESFSDPVFTFLDVGGGIVWAFNNQSNAMKVNNNHLSKGNIGLSIFHLNSPQYSFNRTGEKLYMKYVMHGNYLLSIPRTRIAINPGFLAYKQGSSSELFIGSMIRLNLVSESKYTGTYKSAGASAGVFIRTGDAVIVSTLFEFSNYAIGFSYDITISALSSASNGRGGFEISLRYISKERNNKRW